MRIRRLLPLLVVLTLTPSAVQAQGFVRWLGRLSGPGPFWGLGTEVALKCFGVEKKPSEAVVARFPCKEATLDDRHTTVYLNVSGSIAENNPLDYQDVGRQEESTAVRMLRLGASFDWTVHRTVDLGAGFGMAYFGGPRFDNFSRGYVQPVRVTFRPLLLRRSAEDHHGWLMVSANWHVLLGTIDGRDFGAPADPFRSHNEQDVECGVSVDVLRLFRRFGDKPGGE